MGLRRCVVAAAVLGSLAPAAAQDAAERRFDRIERMVNVDLAEIGLAGAISALRVTINPGTQAPEHTHTARTSVFVMVQGTLIEHRGDASTEHTTGDVVTVAEGVTHWVENTGTVPVIYVELNATASVTPAGR